MDHPWSMKNHQEIVALVSKQLFYSVFSYLFVLLFCFVFGFQWNGKDVYIGPLPQKKVLGKPSKALLIGWP